MAKKTKKVVRYAEQLERIGSMNPLAGITLGENALAPLNCAYRDDAHGIFLYQGDCLEVLDAIAAKHPDGCFDMIFADPPYFLSNGGITCHAGKMVSVHKGDWDKSRGAEENHNFNRAWLERCQRVLKPNGTIWVTGTHHVIFSVGYAMQQLGMKILNDIAWEKPNPPPNLSCRYFNSHPLTQEVVLLGVVTSNVERIRRMRQNLPGTIVEISPKQYDELKTVSIVDCNDVKLRTLSELVEKIQAKKVRHHKDVPKHVLAAIQAGIKASPIVDEDRKKLIT